jgi:hypothetical protein
MNDVAVLHLSIVQPIVGHPPRWAIESEANDALLVIDYRTSNSRTRIFRPPSNDLCEIEESAIPLIHLKTQ